MQRRCVHISTTLLRGRSFFFNKHHKVTDPELQDPEYFEKKARELPLDEHYTDALKKLYEEKVGSERDLDLKAHDNLVRDRVTFGLPELDQSAPRIAFRGIDELQTAPDSVKKIFSLEMGSRRDKTDEWKRQLIDRCSLHSLDDNSLEMKIAWTTALIRHWSMLVEDIAKITDKKPTWLTHRIWLTINWRRKLLGQLREQNRESFEAVLADLKIAFHVPKQPEHVKTRKAWAEAQLRARVEEEKEKRLEQLHITYEQQRKSELAEMRTRREELEAERAAIDSRLEEIALFEDGPRPKDKLYSEQLVGELTEKLIHSQLFYHPKPTMAASQ